MLSIETINLCSAKQMARWFCQRNVDEAHLAFIQPVKDEKQKAVLAILEKMETGCDMEKAYNKDMLE